MNDLLSTFVNAPGESTWDSAALTLLATYALSQLIAYTYERTYEGMSYNRGYVQAIILSGMVAAMLMMAIGDNLARGLGIMGTMALVRYRTSIREPRDMVFMFAGLAVGVAAGVRSYPAALFGTLSFCLAAATLQWSPFGKRHRFDGMLRFWLPKTGASGDDVRRVLSSQCAHFVLVALRDLAQGETLEYAYQVKLRQEGGHDQLIKALETLPGVQGLSLLLESAHTEL